MIKYFNYKKNNKGVILIEAILALGVVVVILTALATALVSSLSSSSFSKDQSLATGFAQEALEIAKNDKDIYYDSFRGLNGTFCVDELDYTINSDQGDCTGNIGRFTRSIYINQSGEDARTNPVVKKCDSSQVNYESAFVASTVSWTDSKCEGNTLCHKVELNSCFADLN